jgi:3-oxocholest-4-en-26-oyl-CoA dehydrogenase beta subunit
MNLDFTDSESALSASAADLLKDNWTTDNVKDVSKGAGHSRHLWQLIAKAGWQGIVFPEDLGGAGGTLFDLGLIYREAGRFLVPTTLYSTVAAALTIYALGTDGQRAKYIPALARGEQTGTLAYTEFGVENALAMIRSRADISDSGKYEVTGMKSFVDNAELADIMVVAAQTGWPGDASLRFFVVEGRDPGTMSITPRSTMGRSPQADVCFSHTALPRHSCLGGEEDGDKSLGRFRQVLDQLTALQCMEMIGGAERVIADTGKYVSEREQFGRPIGTFQAVQGHMADMYIMIYSARMATLKALTLVSNGVASSRQVSIAKALTSRAYKSTTLLAHQLHGGMGIVTEGELFLWSRRAKVASMTLGDEGFHLDRIAAARFGQ